MFLPSWVGMTGRYWRGYGGKGQGRRHCVRARFKPCGKLSRDLPRLVEHSRRSLDRLLRHDDCRMVITRLRADTQRGLLRASKLRLAVWVVESRSFQRFLIGTVTWIRLRCLTQRLLLENGKLLASGSKDKEASWLMSSDFIEESGSQIRG